jgi:membrane protein
VSTSVPGRPTASGSGSKRGLRAGAAGLIGRLGLARAAVKPTVHAVRETAADARSSRLPQMAAALAYRTIFSLIPMIVVALALLRAFTTDQDIEKVLSRALEYTGVNQIAIEEKPPSAAAEWTILGPVPVLTPDPAESQPPPARLDKFIRDLVQRVSSIPFARIGWIGLGMLIYAALSMLVELERAFNQIYRVPIGRSWARRVTQYWTLLTLGSGFLVATFFVGEQFKGWAIRLTESQGWGGGGLTVGLIGFAVTVAISTLLFLLAYTTVPNTRVSIHAATAGAFVAAILWESGKWGFTQYVRVSAGSGYARLYGSIALVPLFMLWVYLTWVVALFGLQVSYHIQHVRMKTIAQPDEAGEPAIVDPAMILSLTVALAERFDKGEPADAPGLAERLKVQRPIVKQMLDRLAEGGLVHRIKNEGDGEGHERFALARPPGKIMAEEVLGLVESLEGAPGQGDPGGLAATLRQSRLDAVKGKDVASLAGPNAYPYTAAGRGSDDGEKTGGASHVTIPSTAAMPKS